MLLRLQCMRCLCPLAALLPSALSAARPQRSLPACVPQVRRAVADERPLEGKQTTVTISVYNAGNT